MKNRIQLSIIIILAITIAVLHYQMKKRPQESEVQSQAGYIQQSSLWKGRFPPNFEVQLLNGDNFVLADHIGQEIIVLNFFATWNSDCQKEMPELNKYFEKNKDNKFLLIGIDADEKEEVVTRFIDDWRVNFQTAIDRDRILIRKFSIAGYPTTVVIGLDGKIAFYESGPILNANIAFDKIMRAQQDIIAQKKNIDKTNYLSQIEQSKDELIVESQKYGEVLLDGRAKEFAAKIHCPIHEFRSLLDCNCYYATQYKKKLMKIKFDHKTDDQILQELFSYSQQTTTRTKTKKND